MVVEAGGAPTQEPVWIEAWLGDPVTARSMGLKTVTRFPVHLTFFEHAWVVMLRYSEMLLLEKVLEEQGTMQFSALFPPKKVANAGTAFIEARRGQLERWLQGVLCSRTGLESEVLHEVLQLPAVARPRVREQLRLLEL